MQYLRERRLDVLIRSLTQPVLGICIGMQLLCRRSEEGETDCLGVFDAEVKRFAARRHEDKIPHIGWNTLTDVKSPLFDAPMEGQYAYFVHSYYVPLASSEGATIATTNYIQPFSAAMHRANFYAVQFHPEKSGATGERILTNFLNL
jgi:glutamine amidotransferase